MSKPASASPGSDDEQEARRKREAQDGEPSGKPTAPAPKTRPRWARERGDDLLQGQSVQSVAELAGGDFLMTFDADDVDGGKAPLRAAKRYYDSAMKFIESAGNLLLVKEMNLVHSVQFVLVPAVAGSQLAYLDDRARQRPDAPILDEPDRQLLVPEAVYAAATINRLLSLPPDEAFPYALAETAGFAGAYADLARTLSAEQGGLTVTGTALDEVRLSASRADRITAFANQPTPAPHEDFSVRGTLVTADSRNLGRFRVQLDRDVLPDVLAQQTRFIEGGYTSSARTAVEEQGLWNTRVMADVRAFKERLPERADERTTSYQFLSIRPIAI